jgi:uncharacterized Zn finger protein
VPVWKRRLLAEKKLAKLRKKGPPVAPVNIEGRQIATTFWGRAWCDNLEAYSDFENRLPRGRTYVRNGSVMDLQIESGKVTALVSGSDLYTVQVGIRPLDSRRWKSIRKVCAGGIDSLVELLQGRFAHGVMEVITRKGTGLFPAPAEITMKCSCPDWATMCKHVAATLYGVGARLDEQPEMLFLLRNVDHTELIREAGSAAALEHGAVPASGRVLAEGDLGGLFGIDLETPRAARPAAGPHAAAKARRAVPAAASTPKPTDATSAKPSQARPLRATRAKTTATKKLVAARRLQGQYIGLLRHLAGSLRGRVKTVAKKSGIAAAVAEMKRLLGRG